MELKNQQELAKINGNLLSLQRENVDDNETVKVITFLTLIYLPGSFVAVSLLIFFIYTVSWSPHYSRMYYLLTLYVLCEKSLFGTNLTFYNQNTSRMRVADNAWWYIVILLPLTLITISVWYFKTQSSRRKRAARAAGMQALEAVTADGSIQLKALKEMVHKHIQNQV